MAGLSAPAEPPARVVGARSEGAARRLWVDLLGARCDQREGRLVLRWSDSPLRLAVDLEPAAASEGARAVEVACTRRPALPEGPHPLLGAAFVQVGDSA